MNLHGSKIQSYLLKINSNLGYHADNKNCLVPFYNKSHVFFNKGNKMIPLCNNLK